MSYGARLKEILKEKNMSVKELSKKAHALGKPHACEDIYKEILKLTGGR